MYTTPTLRFTPNMSTIEAGNAVNIEVRARHGSAIYAISLASDPDCTVFVSLKRVEAEGSLWHAVDAYATECLVVAERGSTGEFLRNKLYGTFQRCHRVLEHLYL